MTVTATVATFTDANPLAHDRGLHGDDQLGRRHDLERDDHGGPNTKIFSVNGAATPIRKKAITRSP